MIKAGTYEGTITGVGLGKSSNKGTPYVYLEVMVATEEEGDVTRTVNLYLSGKAKKYTEDKLQKLGFNFDPSDPKVTELGVKVRCKHETYEDKAREKWDLAGGGIEHAEIDQDAVDVLTAGWKDKRKGSSRQEAWDTFEKEHGEEASADKWEELLKAVVPDKNELDFTPGDWLKVKERSAVPF